MSTSKNKLDTGLIRELAAILREADLGELEVEYEGLRVKVTKPVPAPVMQAAVAAPALAATPAAAPAAAAPAGAAPVFARPLACHGVQVRRGALQRDRGRPGGGAPGEEQRRGEGSGSAGDRACGGSHRPVSGFRVIAVVPRGRQGWSTSSSGRRGVGGVSSA